jgi:hypothetical protein
MWYVFFLVAKREGGFDNDYSEWLAQFDGDHEQSTLEQKHGPVTRPEYELRPVRDPKTREFVWVVRDIRQGSLITSRIL